MISLFAHVLHVENWYTGFNIQWCLTTVFKVRSIARLFVGTDKMPGNEAMLLLGS